MPEQLPNQIKKLVSLLGLRGAVVDVDESTHRISVTVDEDEWFAKILPDFVRDLKYIATLLARKSSDETYIIDVNNYRKEREHLIIELAKAAAQKAVQTKQEVRLPSMNAYERRLVHVELSMRPDVKTESIGDSKDRGVVIKPI